MNKNRFIHFIRRALADAWLAILVSGIIAGVHEYWIIRMPIIVIIQTRVISCFTRMFYGLFRDYVLLAVTSKSVVHTTWEYIIVNTFCSLVYNGILYTAILYVTGANNTHIIKAVCNVLVFSMATGVIYGLCMDYFRNLFDVVIPRIWKQLHAKVKSQK